MREFIDLFARIGDGVAKAALSAFTWVADSLDRSADRIDESTQGRRDAWATTDQVQLAFAAWMMTTAGIRAGTPPSEVVRAFPSEYREFLWALRAASIITHAEG